MNPASVYPLFITLAAVSGLIIFRIRRSMRGIKVSKGKSIGLSAYFLGFTIYAISTSFMIGVPTFFAVAYAAIFSAAAYFSYSYSKNRLTFWKKRDGSIWTKGGTAIMIVYIASLFARITLSFAFGGPQGFYVNPFQPNMEQAAPDAVLALSVVDGLLVTSAGLLVGRNVLLLKRFRRITSGQEPVQELE